MKHLKTYENYNQKNIKKYVVSFLAVTNEYYVDTIIKYDEESLIYNMTYKYNEKFRTLVGLKNENNIEYKSENDIKYYLGVIRFTSNKLEKCLDFLKMTTQIDKYNL